MRELEFLRQTLLSINGFKPSLDDKQSLSIEAFMPGEYSSQKPLAKRRTPQEEIEFHRSLAASHQQR